jgi:alpha-beta hydrolase superfamily lysophospholipase
LAKAFENTGGVAYRHWTHQTPRAIFLLVHGLGAHAGRWDAAGNCFLKHGISSYAVELKDHGRASSAGFGDYRTKLLNLREIALKEVGSAVPVFLIGESLGAVLSFLVCVGNPGLFKGLICISPAFTARYKVPFFDSVKMLAALFYNPNKKFSLPFDSSMCTRDPECKGRLDCDPHEYRSASSKMIFSILAAQALAKGLFGKLNTPVLFLAGGNDLLVDPRSIRDALNALKVRDKEMVEFPGMYHSLSIDTGKEEVFDTILKWVEGRII